MHINEIRYLSDDELREVFKECTKQLFERDIKLPLSEHDVWKYIQTVSNIEAIDIEDAAVARQDHLKATYLVDMDEKRNIPLKDGRYLRIGDLFTYEQFMEEVKEGGINNYDGSGYWAYEDKVSELSYEFYTGNDWAILEKYGFTHILWFNK
jgi:hypothetical protein